MSEKGRMESDGCQGRRAKAKAASSGDSERDPLEVLAARFAERLRAGEAPSVEQYAKAHPELAEKIRELFPMIAAMERLKMEREESGSKGGRVGPVLLERLGDFRIIREIGRGGMGIVYEAEQESLGRRVAVKVLPRHALLDARHLKRFHREARVAAKLHHTNIVPVFGVGRHNGFHYYVMQYIRGVSLDAVLRRFIEEPSEDLTVVAQRLVKEHFGPAPSDSTETPDTTAPAQAPPTGAQDPQSHKADSGAAFPGDMKEGRKQELSQRYFRTVAQLGLQLAEALSYAHSQGTLHRDIKPGNLLLDARGVVWITDFGLAKVMEQDNITQSGDVVGTLRYMAPEQFEGKADPRSDIYSLGLTLYELVTLKPAFEARDKHSLIKKITYENPAAPRRIQPAVPRDLETIILKAVAKDPNHRYASAADLAEDLKLFLEDRPIKARRTNAAERLWRWAKRNKTLAALTTISVLSLITVAVTATTAYIHTRRAMQGEARQRRKAEATAELAVAALDKIFRRFAPSPLVPSSGLTVQDSTGQNIEVVVQPVLSKEAASLLEQLLSFYDKLAQQGGDQPLLRLKIAEANRRVADIHKRLGNVTEAKEAYLRALEAYNIAGAPSRDIEVARIYNELGDLCAMTGDWKTAEAFHLNALTLLQAASEASGLDPRYRFELARAHYFLARTPVPWSGSRGSVRWKGPAPPPPPHPKGAYRPGRRPFAGSGPPRRRLRGFLRFRRHPPGGARPGRALPPEWEKILSRKRSHLEEAINVLRDLVASDSAVPQCRFLLARCYRELAVGVPPWQGDRARRALREATRLLEALVAEFPEVVDYRFELSQTYAMVPPDPSQERNAENQLQKALVLARELVAAQPNVPAYRVSLVTILHRLAELKRRMEAFDQAAKLLEEALQVQARLVKNHPEVTGFKVWDIILRMSLARTNRALAERDGRTERLREDLERLKKAVASLENITGTSGEFPLRWLLGRLYFSLAELQEKMSMKAEAEKSRQRGRALFAPPGFRRQDRPKQPASSPQGRK